MSAHPIDLGLSLARGGPLSEEPGLGSLTLPGYFKEVTSRFKEREALVMHSEGATCRWRYGELWERAFEVARALVALGVGKNVPVGILMTNRPEWLSATFGAWLAGATAVPLSTFSTASELEYLLQASGISVLMFEGRVLKKDFSAMLGEIEPGMRDAAPGTLKSLKFPFLRHVIVLDAQASGAVESWAAFLARARLTDPEIIDRIVDSVQPADTGALFFSSGSTARPKGIVCSQRAVAIQFWRWARIYAVHEQVRAWTPNGFFWSGNCASVMGATLSCGGSLVLQSTFVPSESLRLMELERVNYPMVWPHQAKLLVEAPNWLQVDLSAMHYLDAASPIAQHPTVRLSGWSEPRHSYGSTETFTITTSFASNTPSSITGASHGEALAGNTIKIVDPVLGQTVLRGERGEIAVKGPTLMLGYLGVPNDEVLDEQGFYRTGDSGYLDERGRLYFEGRLTTVIKTGGANVSPLEIDRVLEAFPGVKAARAVGVPHASLGEMVVACVVALEDSSVDPAALLSYAKAQLASYKIPRHVLFFRADEIALTSSAKIKPAELRELAIERIRQETIENVPKIPGAII